MNPGSVSPPGWALPLGGALALVAFFPLVLGGWREEQAFERVTYELQHEALKRVALESGDEPLRVVALGQSLLRDATFDARDMEELAREEHGLELLWARVVRSGGEATDWSEQAHRALAARPDVILLEQRFLSLHEVLDTFGARLRYLARCGRARLRRLVGTSGAWGARGVDALPAGDARRALERTRGLGLAALLDGVVSARPTFPLAEFVRECRSSGITVVVLEVPLHGSAQRSGPLGVAVSDAATIELVARHGLQHWTCELELGLDDYQADRGHLSDTGRARYASWLLDRLAQRGVQRR